MGVIAFKQIHAPVGVLANHPDHGVVEVLDRDGDNREIEIPLYNGNEEYLGTAPVWVKASILTVTKDHIAKTGLSNGEFG